jgi:hypothetical protein
MARWLQHAGAFGIGTKINRPIFNAVKQSKPDLIWVDQGAYLGAGLITNLRTLSVPTPLARARSSRSRNICAHYPVRQNRRGDAGQGQSGPAPDQKLRNSGDRRAFMCQRMDEHRESFEEGMEAVFWNDAKECVDQCRRLLNDDALVAAIKKNGHQRYLQSEHNNESVLKAILNHEALLNRKENERSAVSSIAD